MKNILELRAFVDNKSDLVIYKNLYKELRNRDAEYENRFLATEIYNATVKYFYQYSEDDSEVDFALEKLLNVDEESFSVIGIMSIYAKVLKGKDGFLLSDDNKIDKHKVTNKNIQYLMNKSGYYDYMLYMISLSETMGISDNFREGLMDYFTYNENSIREYIKNLYLFKENEISLESQFKEINYLSFKAV